jgi:hypothetical protein
MTPHRSNSDDVQFLVLEQLRFYRFATTSDNLGNCLPFVPFLARHPRNRQIVRSNNAKATEIYG